MTSGCPVPQDCAGAGRPHGVECGGAARGVRGGQPEDRIPAGDYPDFTVPDRKPPIKYLWYDEDGRLWVQLWEADGDSLATAHVYDHGG